MIMTRRLNLVVIVVTIVLICGNKDPPKKKKDIRDYNDADLERLYDQWEEDEEPLEPDELPEHLRPAPQIDLSKIDTSNPEALLQMSKKGKTVMMFVTVAGKPAREDADKLTQLWQSSLFNAHVDCQRFLVDDDRAIFMFKDGSQAWEAKDFLLKQDKCLEITIEGKSYPGAASKGDKSKSRTDL